MEKAETEGSISDKAELDSINALEVPQEIVENKSFLELKGYPDLPAHQHISYLCHSIFHQWQRINPLIHLPK
jgi:hypothetical protein